MRDSTPPAGELLGKTTQPSHQRRVRRLSGGGGCQCGTGSGNPHHCRQSLDPENQGCRSFLERAPPRPSSLHAHYPSWLNQVEIWFSKIQRDIIVRGVFESISQGKSCDTSATTTKRRSPSDRSSPSIRTTELPKYRRANPMSRSLSSATVH